jgi:spore maturation protein SpmA
MNIIFYALVLVSFVVAGINQVLWDGPGADPEAKSPMTELGLRMLDMAETSVTLAIGLIGVMGLFLGLMKVAEAGGLLRIVAKVMRPLMVRLFPDVPAEHPAMGAIIMNMSANFLGLGNAATPFGIRAMQELDKLNPHKGTATNAMALFLAINTSSITLLPTGVIALRMAAGSDMPDAIVQTTLIATILSTTVAIIAAKSLQNLYALPAPDPIERAEEDVETNETLPDEAGEAYPAWVSIVALLCLLSLVPVMVLFSHVIGPWIIPSLMVGLLTFGVAKRVSIYETFVEGAKEGFQVAVRIIPYLVAILVAIGMFRASGAMDLLIGPLGALTEPLGLPADALPMALMRPLSGSGAYGIVASIINDPSIGPDSYTGILVSTLQGSTETTFYVLAVYFGAIGIKRIRHALPAALIADLAGICGAVLAVALLFGHLA